jgi:hypothetical protein
MKKGEKQNFDGKLMKIHNDVIAFEKKLARVRHEPAQDRPREGVRMETLIAMNQLFGMGE